MVKFNVAAFLCFCVPLIAWAQGSQPPISLFPTTVVENLRSTGKAAADIETGLEGIVEQIDQQRKLYEDNDCPANSTDPGCITLRKQISETYLDMLKHLEAGLPEIQRTISVTKNDLEKRISTQLGRAITAENLQNMLLNQTTSAEESPIKKLQRQGSMRLSRRFQQYYQLVRTSAASSQNSLALMASEIYLDLDEAQNFITLTQQEMQRARILVELDQELGLVSNEMLAVIDGAKAIIFGERVEEPTQLLAPTLNADANTNFRSPLER